MYFVDFMCCYDSRNFVVWNVDALLVWQHFTNSLVSCSQIELIRHYYGPSANHEFHHFQRIEEILNVDKGPSIKYVSTFSAIFDPLPHVSNRQHFKTPLKSTSEFLNSPLPICTYF